MLVNPKDVHALADRICLLLADRDLAKKMGDRGLSKVRRRVRPAVAAETLQDLYRRFALDSRA
jgi:glycosyltransferase involved in cell wall biosynthesis